LVQADNFVLQDIGLEDAPGDIVKILGANGVTIQRVRTEWTDGAQTSNGSYGLYPVQCRSVLIEDSVVKGASDAGVYVGQSRNIVVRRNNIQFNVAGVEIENSTDADVYQNTATNNTGGLLVFNLPGPPIQDGRRTRLFDNDSFENNTPNFAPSGNTVAGVPKGTGSMVLSNDQVEVFNNRFRDNDTVQVLLVSYNTAAALANQPPPNNPDFDPYSETVYVHDNTYVGGGTDPDLPAEVIGLIGGTAMPDIIFDGDVDPKKKVDGVLPDALRTCVQEAPGTTFIDLDLANGTAGKTHDISTVNCSQEPLSPVLLNEGRHIVIPAGTSSDDILQTLLEAQAGDDILIKAGHYTITSALSLTVDHVTLRGEGMNDTVLDLSGVPTGGEGLLVEANDFTIEDIGLENAPGDQLKVLGADGVSVRRVRAEWTAGPNVTNGAYGIYPVQCKDVLVEQSVAKGASDTGIYVGQSRNIIVRNNDVELNVAGIEIENSTKADVHDNLSTHNTGGILVFNLPGLQVYGQRTRVYNNMIVENNTANFAPAGNIVAGVPDGTGTFILANDQVEIFGNTYQDNNSGGISVISFNTAQFLGVPPPNDPSFDPYTESVYIHDNTYIGGGTMPDSDLDPLLQLIGREQVPQVVVDGDIDSAKENGGTLPDALRTCLQEPSAPSFANLNLSALIAGTGMPSFDPAPFNCSLTALTPVAIPGVK